MKRRSFASAAGIAALIMAAPALSQGASGGSHRGGMSGTAGSRAGGMGGGAGMGVGMGSGASSPNGVGAGSILTGIDRATSATSGNTHATAGFGSALDMRASAQNRRDTARANSQGPAHASPTGVAHANTNSVLSGTGTTTTDLSALATGMTVLDANGNTIGTVSRVIKTADGTVRTVQVRLNGTGRVYVLAPSTLSISGSTVTTTWTNPHG